MRCDDPTCAGNYTIIVETCRDVNCSAEYTCKTGSAYPSDATTSRDARCVYNDTGVLVLGTWELPDETCEREWAGQGRAGQGRAGQGRAGQGRAGQGRAGAKWLFSIPASLRWTWNHEGGSV